MGCLLLFISNFNEWVNYKKKMQTYIHKHLLWMTSLLPSCNGFIRLCRKCHVIGISWHDNNNSSSRITWTFCCCADKLCATMMQHLVGGKKIFSFTLFLVIKAKMKFFKITLLLLQHHRSWTVWYYYCQNLFSSKFDRSFFSVSNIHLTTATVTQL